VFVNQKKEVKVPLQADFGFQREMQTAVAHHSAGQLAQAEAIYRHILTQQPNHAPALHLLGIAAHQRSDNETAVRLVTEAIRFSPLVVDFHANLGLIYHAMNRLPEAAAALAEAVRLEPRHADALNNLGSMLKALGRPDEAVAHFQRAVAARPDFRMALLNLADTLRERRRLEEAVAAYRSLAALPPADAKVLYRLALVLQELGRQGEAAAEYQRVIQLDPQCFEAHANLGNVLIALAQPELAIASHRQAVRLRPDLAECRINLAAALLYCGLVEEAREESLTAIRLNSGLDDAWTTSLLTLQYRLHPPVMVLDAHRQWAQARAQPLPQVPRPAARPATGRLRVGLVSPDFFDHPIAYFLEPLLAEHDRARLEFTCYSSVGRPDAFTARLQAHADRWRHVAGLTHEQLANQIAADGIDILIDLAGHTAGSRMPVLARQPAPIQVSYLGYASTTGLPTMAFRLTDAYADPPGLTEAQYTEQMVRLPRTLACYAPPAHAPLVGELPALRPGRGGRVMFASFSNLAKIAPQTIEMWAATLRAVPNSGLTIMGRGADGAEFGRRLRSSFTAAGIDSARIELRPSAAIEQYLAFHNEVDAVLDTFPFNGHTTLCHALWMGVPVVTRAGDRFASRLGLTVLTNAGLPQLVADSPERFAQIAAELVRDLTCLAELRRGLRQQLSNSALMDRRQFARDFEAALRTTITIPASRAP